MLDGAFHAGHAYAEISDPARALSHPRFFVLHAGKCEPENAEQILECRFVIAQMLASEDRLEEALDELRALRPLFQAAYGDGSTHLHNLERQIERLRST